MLKKHKAEFRDLSANLKFPKLQPKYAFHDFSCDKQFFGKFEIDREIQKFNLLMIFKIIRPKMALIRKWKILEIHQNSQFLYSDTDLP